MDDDTLEPETQSPSRLARPVTMRALVVAMVLTAVLAIAAGVALSAVFLEAGPAGPAGEEGPAGPTGPTGDAGKNVDVDPEQVHAAIEDDPARVAEAISDELDFAPASVASDLEDVRASADEAASTADSVRTDLDELCGQLRLAQALSDVFVSC